MRSSGKTPIAPLITLEWSVVNLSTRSADGHFKPVRRHSGWLGSSATAQRQAGFADTDVMNATRKSPGESQAATIRHGRRFDAVSAENGNAAMTISPGRNIARSTAETWIGSTRNNVGVVIEIGFFRQKSKAAARHRQLSQLVARRLVTGERHDRQSCRPRPRPAPRNAHRTVFFDCDRDQLHCPQAIPAHTSDKG